MTDTPTPVPAASERTAWSLEKLNEWWNWSGPRPDLPVHTIGDLLALVDTLSARAEAAERELAATLGMLGEVTDWCKGYEAQILCLTKEREAAEARAERVRAEALKACRKAMRDCFDEEFESLQEGLMTDADITDKEREGMRWQLKALDVWREDMPDRAELYAIAALTAPPPTAKEG